MSKHRNHCGTRAGSTKTGFALIELLLVIAILSLMFQLMLPAIQSAREAARNLQCQQNLH